jgi:UTP--glucose-1-phosphate uridylyltransferase
MAINCTKAIIPLAGFGTRRLPITKAIEKCMLPVGNRPIVDYVVEDCIKAGITDIIFVVSEQFNQLQTYYGNNQLLEEYLAHKGKQKELDEVKGLSKKANFHYIVQDQHQPHGTAVPVGLCANMVNQGEHVLVLMGDDFIYNADGSSEVERLIKQVEATGATAGLLAAHVPKEEVGKYGVIEMSTSDGNDFFARIVEQPKPEEAPSNLINISKYLFDAQMFGFVKQVLAEPPAANGEYQIIEALNHYVKSGKPLTVVEATGEYLDGGTLPGWLHANNRVCA